MMNVNFSNIFKKFKNSRKNSIISKFKFPNIQLKTRPQGSSKSKNIFRYIKIRTRLILSYMVLLLLPLLIVGILSYTKSSESIKSKISGYSYQLTDQVKVNIKSELEKYQNTIDGISFGTGVQEGLDGFDTASAYDKYERRKKITDSFTGKSGTSSIIMNIGILAENGEKITTGNDITDSVASAINKLSKTKSGQNLWSIQNDGTGTTVRNNLYLSKNIKSLKTGQSLGIGFVAIKPEAISNIYTNLDMGKGAKTFIIDSNGVIISDKDANNIGNKYKDPNFIKKIQDNLTESEKNKSQRVFTYNIENENSIVSYSAIDNTDWYVVVAIPFSFLMNESKSIGWSIFLTALVAFLLAMVLAFLISNSISKPLNNLTNLMDEAKDGNLSVHIDDSSGDEIGQVITSFNEMILKISSLIFNVKKLSDNVLDSTNKIKRVSDTSYAASEQIAYTMQEIAKGATDQATEVTDGVNNMEILSEGIGLVDEHMNKVSEVITNTKNLKQEALTSVQSLNDKAIETSSASEKIVEEINSLNNSMKEIKSIVKLIVGIAEQTNLLSLNASIEAARAGEAGRGFAVVADEVKKLADQSKDASIKINDIINSLQNKTEMTTKEANKTSVIVKQQMDAVVKADNAFNVIFASMEDIASQMQQMGESVQGVLNSKENTNKIMCSISAITEETAATTEEVSASTEEQIASAEELAKFAEDLDKLSKELNDAIALFKVE